MKFVYPITKSDGSEFSAQDELETVIGEETIGQYGFNPSHNTFHGGIHFTKVNAPWVRKYYPIRAIADGNIIACRLSEDYPETEYGHQTLPFSHDFCLIEHEFDYKDDDDNDATFNFYSLYMHLATITDDKSDVEEEPIQYVLAQSWNARAMPKISSELNTCIRLKKGTVLSLDEDSQPRTFESNGTTYNFKKYEIKDNKGLRDSLAGVGNNVWLADDPSPKESDPQFIITGGPVENAPEPIWFYQKLTGEITCNTSIRVRSDPKTNGDAGDVIGQAYNGCTISFSRTSDTKFCRIGRKKYLMARCDFTNNKAFQGNQKTVKLSSGWIAVTDDYVKVNEKSDILDFNDETTLVTSTTIPVKAGEPIGYLGRFDVLNYDQERGYVADKRYQLHHELISIDKPPKAFLTAFFGDENAASLQFASDENSHGYLLKKDPSDFFRDLALCAKKSVTNVEECDAVTVEDDELKSVLLPQDASKLTVVQHTSEWYHKSDTSLLFQELTYLYGDNKRLKHEKDRADQLAWMQDTALFKDNAVVWNWWPVSKIELFTVADVRSIVKKLRLSENLHNFELFTSSRCTLPENMKNFESFTKVLNITLLKYGINNRLRKIHFLSQIYHETDRLRTTTEYASGKAYNPAEGVDAKHNNGNGPGDGPKYKGRGLLQLTWKDNYQLYKEYSDIDVITNYEKVSNDLEVAIDSAGWFFKQGKRFSNSEYWSANSNSPEYIKVYNASYKKLEVGIETNKYKTIDFNMIADNDQVDLISYFVNGGSNGLQERRNYCKILKEIM